MCGFVGFTNKNEAQLKIAQNLIKHRGPDSQGVFFDDKISFGHNRLSIIDLSENGAQPMRSADGQLIIIFNGEIYNYQALKQELESRGRLFSSHSDTEVILAGYAEWGSQVFSRLRGMWALAIYDQAKQEIVLSRDHFGIKPLYYALEDNVFYFASELKALKPLLKRLTPNKTAYYQFFNLGYFVDPATCYEEVKKLEPGLVARHRIGSREISYERSALIEQVESPAEAGNFDQAAVILNQALRDSVEAHYIADVPVGLLLSGGNDSSLLAALSVALGKQPIAYNLNIQNSLDSGYARQVAGHLGVELRETTMDRQALVEQYEKIWDFVDEPTADSSIIPTSLVYSTIAKDTKVVLSGEGGDEMFGGYRRHESLWRHNRIREKNRLFAALNALQGSNRLSLDYLNPLLARLRNGYLGRTDDIISAYLSSASLLNRSFAEKEIRRLLYSIINGSEENGRNNNLFFDRKLYLPNDLMYKNDIASMQSSIEARVPFLDKVLYNIVSSQIKPEYCLSSQYQGKLILKKVMEKYLPKDLIYRPKKGFSFSFQKYQIANFRADLKKALQFHHDHREDFNLTNDLAHLMNPKHADLLIKKFPSFAFGVVSNWRVFK